MRLASVVVLAAFLLAGCTTAPEPAAPEVSQAPVEVPSIATGLQISGRGLTVVYDDGEFSEIPFTTDSAEAIETLALVFGVGPATSHSEELACQPGFDNAAWPGLSIRSAFANLPDDQKFAVTIDAAQSGNIALSTSEGVAVGGDGDEAFSALKNPKRDRATDQGVNYDTIFFDRQQGGDSGGYLFAADDKVVTIISPVDYATLDC